MRHKKAGLGRAFSVLLVLVAGLGAWNYHRNWSAEINRPGAGAFSHYSDFELSTLAEGYRAEIEALEERRAMGWPAIEASPEEALFGEKLKAFERVQHSSGQERDLLGRIGKLEVRLREVEQERAYRVHRPKDRLRLHLARLTGM